MSHHTIEVEHLTYRYPNGHLALDDVSLFIEMGEKVALVGANGSGKSTLLLHLNGVLRGQSGRLTVGGLPLSEATLGQIRGMVGLVFQNPDDQLFSLRVADDVAFGLIHRGAPAAEMPERVRAALAAVGMDGTQERLSHHLSLGEKKRVALATVLVLQPEILVLDEPSAGLDPRGRRELIALLRGMDYPTMLISTHDMRLARDLCSRVVVLNRGRVAADGDAQTLLHDAALMEAHGLETP